MGNENVSCSWARIIFELVKYIYCLLCTSVHLSIDEEKVGLAQKKRRHQTGPF